MKLRVQHEFGRIEILSLAPPVQFFEGVAQSYILSGEGLEHYFTQDGYYDGWARNTSNLSDDEVDDLLEQMEKDRVMED